MKVLHLQKVLVRKRDPVTHVVFIDLFIDNKVHTHSSNRVKLSSVKFAAKNLDTMSYRTLFNIDY